MRIAIAANSRVEADYLHWIMSARKDIRYTKIYPHLTDIIIELQKGKKYDVILLTYQSNENKESLEDTYADHLNDLKTEDKQKIPKLVLLSEADKGKNLPESFHQFIDAKGDNLTGKISFAQKKRIFEIKYDEIYFIESSAHRIYINTRKGQYSSYTKLSDIKVQLPPWFLQCHKSYLVNLYYIVKIEKQTVHLVNNVKIPISKARNKETKMIYDSYGKWIQS